MPMSSTPISPGLTKPTLLRSRSEPILNANAPEQPSKPVQSDSVSINPKTKPAPNSAKVSKLPYQFIIDFFQELGKKIMDLFTPTSKEAIEKALGDSKSKTEIYEARIISHEQRLNAEDLSEKDKKVLTEDIQKAQKKLGQYQAKIDTLGAKLDTLASNTAQATEAKVFNSATKDLEEAAEEILKEADSLINKAKKFAPELFNLLANLFKKARP